MSFSPVAIAARIHYNRVCHKFITQIDLPIVSIHGFPVSAIFIRRNVRENLDGVYFEISATTIGKQSHQFYAAFLGMVISEEKTQEYIRDAYESVRYLVFDKLTGQFIDSRLPKLPSPFIPELEGIPFVSLSYQACPCCSEYTKTKTACDHPLCLDCWRKIPIEETYVATIDDIIEHRPCPMCNYDCNSYR